jgi:hypothetical protein
VISKAARTCLFGQCDEGRRLSGFGNLDVEVHGSKYVSLMRVLEMALKDQAAVGGFDNRAAAGDGCCDSRLPEELEVRMHDSGHPESDRGYVGLYGFSRLLQIEAYV